VTSRGREAERTWLVMGGFAVAYAVAVAAGRLTADAASGISLVWPAAGVGAAWLVWVSRRTRLVSIAAALIFVGSGVLNFATGTGALLGLAFGASNALQGLATLWTLRALHRHWSSTEWRRVRNLRDMLALGAASVVGPALALGMGPLAAVTTTGADPLPLFLSWFMRNAAGTFVVLPAILVMRTHEERDDGLWREISRRPFEYAAVLTATFATHVTVFGNESSLPLAFVVLVPTLWAALRFGAQATVPPLLLASSLATLFTLHGSGPFSSLDPSIRSMRVQLLGVVLAGVSWAVVMQKEALRSSQRAALEARRASEAEAHLLDSVLRSSSDAISVYGADGRALFRNPASYRLFPDSTPACVADDEWDVRFEVRYPGAEDTITVATHPVARALAGETTPDTDVVVTDRVTGAVRTISMATSPLRGGEGTQWEGGAVLTARDVTAERASTEELGEAHREYSEMISATTQQALLACDSEGIIRFANEGATRMLMLPNDHFVGLHISALHDYNNLATKARAHGTTPHDMHATMAREGMNETGRCLWVDANDERVVVDVTITPTTSGGFLVVASDVTQQAEAEQRLATSERRFRTAFDTAPVAMFIVDWSAGGEIVETNTTAEVFTGLDEVDLRSRFLDSLVHLPDVATFESWAHAVGDGDVPTATFEVRFVTEQGALKWGTMSVRLLDPEVESDVKLLCLVEDITARKQAEAELVHQALHDELTGLPNRVLLRDRLTVALQSLTRRPGKALGVLFCDLDGFKDVNDAYGHPEGDAVLKLVAERFAAIIRPHDTLARMGGDEFAVVAVDVAGNGTLRHVAERLIASLEEPVITPHGQHHLGVSIGYALATDTMDQDSLLAQADAAMYVAKRAGKNRSHSYDDALDEKSHQTTQLVPEFSRAVEAGEFVLFGQPVVDLPSGKVVAIETLLRWDHPTKGLLSPEAFLETLESTGLMVNVGLQVLRDSCDFAAGLARRAGGRAISVHVNVSGRQLSTGRFTDAVCVALEDSGLAPDNLVLELTETFMPTMSPSLVDDLEALRRLGVRIALDDIGTGYSSLARLTEMPVDILKIDRTFISPAGRDERKDAVVKAVIGMADALGIEVVAEGVETETAAQRVLRHGCELAQGYLFSKPVPLDEIAALCDKLEGGSRTPLARHLVPMQQRRA